MSSTTYSSNNFDLTQSLFLMSWIANYSGVPCGSAKQLADYVYVSYKGTSTEHVNPFKTLNAPNLLNKYTLADGDWDIVWGPAVYQINPCAQKADNTACVLKDSKTNTYVVAIAGTDAGSILDWLVEDFQVGKSDRIDWTAFKHSLELIKLKKTTKPDAVEQISYGTAFGIKALLTGPTANPAHFQLSTWAPNSDKSLGDFLISLKSDASSVIVTGHSLGGALSPTLARWLYDMWHDTPESATEKHPPVFSMPTAGPTPGNGLYQDKWDKIFTPGLPEKFPLKNFNTKLGNKVTQLNRDIGNNCDPVPHAWANIHSILDTGDHFFWQSVKKLVASKIGHFVNDATMDAAINGLVIYLGKKGASADMTRSKHYQGIEPVWPINTIDPSTHLPVDVPLLNSDTAYDLTDKGFQKFLANVGNIHVWGYSTAAFGIDFATVMQKIAAKNPSKTTS